MKKIHLLTALAFTTIIASGVVYAATFSYKCPRCGYTATYDRPAQSPRCPSDGSYMVLSQ